MRTEYYGLKELAAARELQQACKALHLPPPPVVSWKAELFDEFGHQTELHIGKSNSYVRSGLNMIFTHSCYPHYSVRAITFVDGTIGVKKTDGSNSSANYWQGYYQNSLIKPGYGDTAESIDLYNLANVFGSGNSVNQLNWSAASIATSFDAGTRKFLNDCMRSFQNGYGSAQDIKEMGLFVDTNAVYSTSYAVTDVMVIRDLLPSPLSVAAGGGIVLHYNFELPY